MSLLISTSLLLQRVPYQTKGDIGVMGPSGPTVIGVGSNGTVLMANSNLANGVGWYMPGMPRGGTVSGRYYHALKGAAFTTSSLSANRLYAGCPFYVNERTTFAGIGIQVGTLGGATNARFGVYTFSSGVPMTRVQDAGAMALSASAENTIAVSITLDPGLYVLGIVVDASSTQVNALSANGPTGYHLGHSSSSAEASRIYMSHTYGALPSSFGTAVYEDGSPAPAIYLKR